MIELYSHNAKAYDAVMSHFAEGHKHACVIQPCGTGKAVVLAAVAQHFDKVYMVAPNEHIHNQAKKVCDKELNCLTYQSLAMENAIYPTDADLIVFDEMHRMGAMNWSKGCERLMEANPEAHVLGLTATPVRALEQRDMSKEYFDGHVVSEMSLTDAWCHGVLKAPQKYVIGLVSMDNEEKDMLAKIRDNKKMDEETKKRASAKVVNICRDWSLSNGVPRIIKKYWDNSIKKVAVFCPTIAMADTIEPTLREWFKDAGYEVNKVYVVHSEESEAAEKIQEFEDSNEGLNVLVCVSMLNEGIHPKGVGSVILLRATVSKNLYLQQIGRCFSVGQKTAPIVFDFADSLSAVCAFDEIYRVRDTYERNRKEKERRGTNDSGCFQVIDLLKSARELSDEIDRTFCDVHFWLVEEIRAEALKYVRRVDFAKESPSAYAAAQRAGVLDDVCSHMKPKPIPWTKERVFEFADQCQSRSEFYSCAGACNYAQKHGMLAEIVARWESRCAEWTEEQLVNLALKYDRYIDFIRHNKNAYYAAKKMGVDSKIRSFLKTSRQSYTFDGILDVAFLCKNKGEFFRLHHKEYDAARSHGWIEGIYERVGWTYKKLKV